MIFLCKVHEVLVEESWGGQGKGAIGLLTGSAAVIDSWHAAATQPPPRRCPVCPYCFAPRSRHASRAHVAGPSRRPQCGLRPRPSPRLSRLCGERKKGERLITYVTKQGGGSVWSLCKWKT